MSPLVAMRQMLIVSHLVITDLERIADRLGYSFADLHLLGRIGIDLGRPVRATDLTTRFFISKAALSGRISRLENDSLLIRRRSADDHRSMELSLTARGEQLVDARIRELVGTAKIAKLFADMDLGEMRGFSAVLTKAQGALERDFIP